MKTIISLYLFGLIFNGGGKKSILSDKYIHEFSFSEDALAQGSGTYGSSGDGIWRQF